MAPAVAISPSLSGPVRIHPKPPSLQQARRASPIRPPGIIMYKNAIHVSNHSLNEETLGVFNSGCITHVFYSSAKLKSDGTVYLDEIDTNKPIGDATGALEACLRLRRKNSIIKVILSVGDSSPEVVEGFRRTAATERSRIRCATTARQLADRYALDGIDIAWENIVHPVDANNYILLLSDMREAFSADQFLLTSSISFNTHIDFKAAAYYLDLINLKCFDFGGPLWSSIVCHTSQTYSRVTSSMTDQGLSCYSAIENLTRQGVPGSKIILGIPTWGWVFLGASWIGEDYSSKQGYGQKLTYREQLMKHGARMEYDDDVKACYTRFEGGGLISFDCPWSVQFKAELVKENNLAGLVFWEATGDHSRHHGSLVAAGWENLLTEGMRPV